MMCDCTSISKHLFISASSKSLLRMLSFHTYVLSSLPHHMLCPSLILSWLLSRRTYMVQHLQFHPSLGTIELLSSLRAQLILMDFELTWLRWTFGIRTSTLTEWLFQLDQSRSRSKAKVHLLQTSTKWGFSECTQHWKIWFLYLKWYMSQLLRSQGLSTQYHPWFLWMSVGK